MALLIGEFVQQRPKLPGVYALTNLETQAQYIGSSSNVGLRVYQHFSLLVKGTHPCKPLQQDFNKFGEISFSVEILEIVEYVLSLDPVHSRLHLRMCEYQWTQKLNPVYSGEFVDPWEKRMNEINRVHRRAIAGLKRTILETQAKIVEMQKILDILQIAQTPEQIKAVIVGSPYLYKFHNDIKNKF